MTNKFDWKITAKKVGITSLAVLLAGGVAVWQDNPYWLALLPILTGLQNWLKHR